MQRIVAFATTLIVSSCPLAEDGEWRMPAKDYASTRYSGLAEINAKNVRQLKVAFTFVTGIERGHEAAPIYTGGMLYIVTPWPNHVFALDAKGIAQLRKTPLLSTGMVSADGRGLLGRGLSEMPVQPFVEATSRFA